MSCSNTLYANGDNASDVRKLWECDQSEIFKVLNFSDTNSANASALPELPVFDERARLGIIMYTCVFVVSCVGNMTVFINLMFFKRNKSRITVLILHLSIADLVVTLIMIPLEIIWRITIAWLAGNVMCKILFFLRAFGLYLSSNVLICISLDRYYAIMHPLRVTAARVRSKIMLRCAWMASIIYSLPQSFVFHTAVHPAFPNFTQCVSFDAFKTRTHEVIYNILGILFMYFIPLIVIMVTYPAIWWKIRKKARFNPAISSNNNGLRRSDDTSLERAKTSTLRMTIMIFVVFVLCWTPYAVLTIWYMVDKETAEKLLPELQEFLFMMAAANSCMNPIVYGSYAVDCKAIFWDRFFKRHSPLNSSARLQRANNSNSLPISTSRLLNMPSTGTKPTPVQESIPLMQQLSSEIPSSRRLLVEADVVI